MKICVETTCGSLRGASHKRLPLNVLSRSVMCQAQRFVFGILVEVCDVLENKVWTLCDGLFGDRNEGLCWYYLWLIWGDSIMICFETHYGNLSCAQDLRCALIVAVCNMPGIKICI